MLLRFENGEPRVADSAYVHPSADVIGDVTIGPRCWIGPGARLRGDYGSLALGAETAVEDNVVIHARPGERTVIGAHVTLGHGCIIHNATVRDWAVIGMGAIVSDWAEVGEWAVIAEGAVVRQRQMVPPQRIAVGVPAKVIEKAVDAAYQAEWTRWKALYADLAGRYAVGIQSVE